MKVFFIKVLKEDKKQESSKMETNEIRAVIKYLCKKGMSPKEIYEDMMHTLEMMILSRTQRISTEDEHRRGRHIESVTQENIEKIHDLKNDSSSDRRDLGYSKTNSGSDHERTLGPQEAFCQSGFQTFDTRSKAVRRKLYSDNIALFEANPEEFVNRFVTMDQTWAYHFTPDSKQQSMQWILFAPSYVDNLLGCIDL
ncbi:hypothetical protein LAZ67_2005982 [Cordylochernes scorpioides]|uniref:Uncharacterized protein n=1 Tax=Cordylochernes scorpioides TaxID=51811 RepID=A0ABY6K4W5_9ARAC|nr:hypothetical protein LAZ67_2005982 [Cordylochernes scorpioides]